MLKDIYVILSQNKNILMLITVFVYILALFSVLSGHSIFFAALITIALTLSVIFNIFKPKYILLWGIIFYFGIINTQFRLKSTDELLNIAPKNAIITGQILTIPQNKKNNKQSFIFKVNQIKYDNITKTFNNEKTLVTTKTKGKLKLYDYYTITGRLSVPFKAGNPSQFDYGNYLRNFSVYSVFYGNQKIEPIKQNVDLTHKEKALQWINDYREKIITIHSNYLGSPNLEILGGIVFGDDAVSPPDSIKQSFINSGLLHILAASGMNVAFIFSFFFFFLKLLRVKYKVNVSIGIIMVLIYSLMTGLGASVIRATLMLVFVLIGKLIDRDAHSVSLLAFVAFLMLLYNPMYINDVGFQLSFVVTFGLLVMTPYLIKFKNRVLNWVVGTISIPIIAQLWVIPIQVFYFNNISLYSIFANIMSVPLLSVISFGGFISSLIAPLLPQIICKIFDFILNPLITMLVNISDFWGNLPHSTLQTTHPNILQIILYYSLLISITAMFKKEFREKYFKFIKIMIATILIILLFTFIKIPNNNLEITAFDVGNADSFLIKTPDNKYLIIDTAKAGYNGGKSVAEILILKYLLDKGIKDIDTVIITHFDNDHCGGAVDLMNGIKVNKIYVNDLNHKSTQAKEIYNTANKQNVKLILAKNKQIVLKNNNLIIKNYMTNAKGVGDNENSIVTLLVYNKFSMLFTGDAGIDTLKDIKNNIKPPITVFKVGHHGANGVINKDLIEYFTPKISLISVGENKFGHPAIFTLETLKHTKILRTDIHNSIKLVVNPNGYNIYTYDSEKKKYQKYKF